MDIKITNEDFQEIIQGFLRKPTDLFLADHSRQIVAKRRYMESQAKGTAVADDLSHLWPGALEHNMKVEASFQSTGRPNRLIRPLFAIDKVAYNAPDLKALCVGPRTEMELLCLVGQGFKAENVRGLDLFSYSPWIDTGNMHDMPYTDNSFDVVIAGWCLVYSDDPHQACREFLRVARHRGIIAIGCTYYSQAMRKAKGETRTEKHYPKVDDLLAVFGAAVRNVYVRHDPEPGADEGRTIVIFDVNK